MLGNFGAEDAEILRISSVNNSTGEIKTTTSSLFPHSESTRVTVIPYNQIRFYHTSVDTFDISTAVALTGFINLQPNDWFTSYTDEAYSDGYGWYVFYNPLTLTYSLESNPIPYAGFESNTTEYIINDFFSMLSNKELKLVTREDALSWASEGYSRMKKKLNLTNTEFSSSEVQTLTLLPGVIEYDLPLDFDHLVAFMSGLNQPGIGTVAPFKENIEYIPLTLAYSYTGTKMRYYIRGKKIGILPTPGEAATLNYIYQKKANRLELNSDVVELPDGGEFVIKDFMMWRAYQKFQNPQQKNFLESFTNGLNDLIISSVKRDANRDTWGSTRESMV